MRQPRVTWYEATRFGVRKVAVIVLGNDRLDIGAGVSRPMHSGYGDYFDTEAEAARFALDLMLRHAEMLKRDTKNTDNLIKRTCLKYNLQ